MIIYPDIDPVALSIGPVKIHWYGLMYLFGFAAAWLLAYARARKPNSGWTTEQISDLIFYAAIGVILGGRLGNMLFYDFQHFINDPLSLFKIWQGGMAFHGGLIGVIIAVWLFSRQTKKNTLDVLDFIAPLVPIGLAAGRLGNFINGELWGRIASETLPWAMVFPHVDAMPRHPSMLYELILEGPVLFIILWWYSAKPRPRFAVASVFLLGYGSFRFIVEFFREPDATEFISWTWLTMGQILSIPMIVIGIAALILTYRCQRKFKCNNI